MIELDLELPLASFALQVAFRFEGGVTAVMGPSGSGKTSLLEAIAGLRRRARGRILLDGSVLMDGARGIALPPEARRVGYVPQDAGLFPHLTAHANVRFGARAEPEAVLGAIATLEIGGREREFHTYWARGASFTGVDDDGTIAPTAAGGSIVFAPEIVIPLCVSGTEGAAVANQEMAQRGLRVLAVAVGDGESERALRLLGLVGIADPPRPEAIAAIAAGRMLATADFNAMAMSELATEAAVRHLRGEAIPAEIILPVQIVDAGICARWDAPFEARPSPDWERTVLGRDVR